MPNLSYEQCISYILEDIAFRQHVDYGSKTSVRQYNAAMNRIIKHVKYIDANFPERRQDFIAMIHHSDPMTAYAISCRVIDTITCPVSVKREAASVYKALVDSGKCGRLPQIALPITLSKWEDKFIQMEQEEQK